MNIRNSFWVLLILGGCATGSTAQSSIPANQCQVLGGGGGKMRYECASGKSHLVDLSGDAAPQLIAYVTTKRVLFFESDESLAAEGLKLLSAALAKTNQLREPSGDPLPAEAYDYSARAELVFISLDRGVVKLTFNMRSHAVVVYSTAEGNLVATYTIF